ncbi:hypothetical protein EYF80_003522 [Liparis tanakae]|uniref:Uncharacterized protein n=1 Tax=Liparis tanakae TaxID=230148 RepID=A0A4Z2J6W2_9TELE|nr:hypothetical protein EYF80_003522 [Liparis tanakae]
MTDRRNPLEMAEGPLGVPECAMQRYQEIKKNPTLHLLRKFRPASCSRHGDQCHQCTVLQRKRA